MNKPPGAGRIPGETVVVLSISPIEEDHLALKQIFGRPEWSFYTESNWTIYPAGGLDSALSVLRDASVAIVLSERDLLPGTWVDVLAEISELADPPLLFVTSRLADDRLWAEALNLGAYDVLLKPFDAAEVIRGLSLAWLQQVESISDRNSKKYDDGGRMTLETALAAFG